jgi:DNA-binding NtrC family response regulator
MGYGLGRESVGNKAAARTVLLASADADLRTRLRQELTAMRWRVREASGGAEAMELLEVEGAEAMVLDSALSDLEVDEFAEEMRTRHPVMELLRIDGIVDEAGARSPRRNELLQALRQAQADSHGPRGVGESAAWTLSPVAVPHSSAADRLAPRGTRTFAAEEVAAMLRGRSAAQPESILHGTGKEENGPAIASPQQAPISGEEREERVETLPRDLTLPLPEMVGESPGMQELARLIRLVAPRTTTVLIEGETGTGKELVARAVHQLSPRAGKPLVVLNCAAIPESLLEAEVFGHTRGAFTGAMQSRTGMIESAHGGTLFLDEIGEMPLSMQSKILRFLESGELQRVGNNEVVRVDTRVLAATDEPLQQRVAEHAFRLDLYHRLAVFPVALPALRERMEDVLPLATHLLAKLSDKMPVKRLSAGAEAKLMEHNWPGNVRELEHVLERASILAEDRQEIAREDIRF